MRGRYSLRCERRREVVEWFRRLGVSRLKLDVWIGPRKRLGKKFRRPGGQAGRGPLDVAIGLSGCN